MIIFGKKDFMDNVLKFAASGEKDSGKLFDMHADMCNKKIEALEKRGDGWLLKQKEETIEKLYEMREKFLERIEAQERLLKHQGQLLDDALRQIAELSRELKE